MKDSFKTVKLIIILILICLILLSIFLIINVKNFNNLSDNDSNQNSTYSNNATGNTTSNLSTKESLREILERYNCTLIRTESVSNSIYLKFDRNLFDSDGTSNEPFFNELVSALSSLYEKKVFYLIDDERNIKIHVVWDSDLERHYIADINGISDFYDQTNGEAYAAVETVEPVQRYLSVPDDYFLSYLSLNGGYFSKIEKKVGECTKEQDGYKYYLDNSLKISVLPNNYVFNVVFNDLYTDEIVLNITTNMSLKEKAEALENNKIEIGFGDVSDGYIGFVGDGYYYFLYDDEVSVYSYTDEDYNDKLCNYLNDYINSYNVYKSMIANENSDKELAKSNLVTAFNSFKQKMMNSYKCYDKFEYDEGIGKLRLRYSILGFDIDIEDYDPKGITMYSDFVYSDEIKQFIKNGQISINSKKDLIELVELERKGKN